MDAASCVYRGHRRREEAPMAHRTTWEEGTSQEPQGRPKPGPPTYPPILY